MRKIIILGTLATALGLAAVVAQASDYSGAKDGSNSAMARETSTDGAGDRHDSDERKIRSSEKSGRSARSDESHEQRERSVRSGETREQHDAREGRDDARATHDESRERNSRR
jgi:hypothetical protein